MDDPSIPREPVAGDMTESRIVFERFRRVFGDGQARSSDSRKRAKREPGSSSPFGAGRDARGIGDIVGTLSAQLGWSGPLAQSDLLASWDAIVGGETAQHSVPVDVVDGILTVRCDSTAWATQLRLMAVQILTRVTSDYPDAGVRTLRFEGPGAPSWKRGRRSIPGRGPRDTYG